MVSLNILFLSEYQVLTLVSIQQPPQTTWLVCGAWRPGRSRGSTAVTRRPWCVWPLMTVCWAEEEDEEDEDSLEGCAAGISWSSLTFFPEMIILRNCSNITMNFSHQGVYSAPP